MVRRVGLKPLLGYVTRSCVAEMVEQGTVKPEVFEGADTSGIRLSHNSDPHVENRPSGLTLGSSLQAEKLSTAIPNSRC